MTLWVKSLLHEEVLCAAAICTVSCKRSSRSFSCTHLFFKKYVTCDASPRNPLVLMCSCSPIGVHYTLHQSSLDGHMHLHLVKILLEHITSIMAD